MHSSIDAYRLLQWPPLDVSQYLGMGVGQTPPEGRPPPPVDRMTDRQTEMAESITLLQFRWRTVIHDLELWK